MRIRATISYDGTEFYGWQVQKHYPTIQSSIEKALARICGEDVAVTGAGRTDSGVHALGQIAHFDWQHQLPLNKLLLAINALLPPAIRVLDLHEVNPDFHARFSARSKLYLYRVDLRRVTDPFNYHFALHYPFPLDLQLLRDCAAVIEGEHDFSAFQATGTDVVSTVRTVTSVQIQTALDASLPATGPVLLVRLQARGFLRKMVRFLVGTMIEIASGRRQIDHLHSALQSGDKIFVGVPAPARGLFLEKVEY